MWQPRERYRGWKTAQLAVGALAVVCFWLLGFAVIATEPTFWSLISTFPERAILYFLTFGAPLFGSLVWVVSAWTRVIAHWTPLKGWLIRRGFHFPDEQRSQNGKSETTP